MDAVDHEAIVRAIREHEALSASSVPLEVFRQAYNRLDPMDAYWIIVCAEEQATVQPMGREDIVIVLCESDSHFYTRRDFQFMDSSNCEIYGTLDGPYAFSDFLNRTIGNGLFIPLVIAWFVGVVYFSVRGRCELIQNISASIISALSIFITVFVLFVLSLDPNKHYRMAEDSTFHILIRSDMYIARIGVASLLCAMASSALCSGFPEMRGQTYPQLARILEAAFLATAAVGTIASFVLVTGYHFRRRAELAQGEMAKDLLSSRQRIAIEEHERLLREQADQEH